MASQKNQHFVPKVHLAPFSTDSNGKSISLYNITGARVIHGAAIKHQCSGSYFYGDDKVLENLFGRIEGRYAEIIREIESGVIRGSAIDWLTMFMVLQYSRTLQAVEVLKEFLQKASAITLRGKTIKEDEKPDLSQKALIIGAMRQFTTMIPYTRDLKFCVMRNRTNIPLVTTDNPLVFTNRFYLQKLGQDTFGISSAGAMLAMPVGPRLAIYLYDPGMYSVDENAGFVDLKKLGDILALNEMQYLNANQNVYFSNPDNGERIAAEFAAVSHRRPDEKAKLVEFAEVDEGRYRRIEGKIDETGLKSKMVMYQTPKPRIARWPSALGFRFRKRAYSNGSAMGFVRHPEWLEGKKPE